MAACWAVAAPRAIRRRERGGSILGSRAGIRAGVYVNQPVAYATQGDRPQAETPRQPCARAHEKPECNAHSRALRDGSVTLAGAVTDTNQSSLSATAARRVDGVASVANLLRIDFQQP